MATLIFSKYLSLGTAADDLNARKLPSFFDGSLSYTPVAIGTEGADKVSAHLKGIDAALGARLLLSGGILTGPLDINAAGASGNSLRCTGSVKIGASTQEATTAGGGSLRWTGSSLLYSDGVEWRNFSTVQSVSIDVIDFDVTAPLGQTVFSAGQDLTGSSIQVFEEGFLRRPFADYTIDATDIIFNYAIAQGQWVSIHISNSTTQSSDFDVSAPAGETAFNLGVELAARSIQVYENGFLRRVGAAKDYIISGTQVIFNYTVIEGTWVRVLVY